jgi:SAM-dependent methyltransferase
MVLTDRGAAGCREEDPGMEELDWLLAEQVRYYRARAGEYDQVYGDRELPTDRLAGLPISGEVLELACGTGQWTPLLAERARSVTAVDAAPEMVALARRRVAGLPVTFVVADVFSWRPSRRFDTVFFAFWLSHVPPARFAGFWAMARSALRPGGWVCFVDTGEREQEIEEVLADEEAPAVRRRLHDGSQHRVIKLFYTPERLTARLAALGWSASIREDEAGFLIGTARPGTG